MTRYQQKEAKKEKIKSIKKTISEVVQMWQEESEMRLKADEKIIGVVKELIEIYEEK